jgi:ribosomal-protein-alanine N-acetyltransferase
VPDCVNSSFPYRVRPMTLEDVDQVAQVEKLCFPLPWPPDTYRRDLRYGGNTHYLVAERVTDGGGLVVGFCGYWLIEGEIHVSTIGVHPEYRGLGLGEYLLARMLADGMEKNASSATLEVRVSNSTAQCLYSKYGFRVTGRRRRYYRDNHEDALVMEVESLSSDSYRAAFERRWQALMTRICPEAAQNAESGAEAGSASPG